jgi:signal transduction histidine kinase
VVARGRPLGALTFALTSPDRRYGPDDLAVAEELARRVAVALENARLYREAQETARLRQEFLSIASHELKTPITTIKANAELLAIQLGKPELDRDRLARYMTRLNGQIARLELLVADLLDVSRLQQGQLRLRLEPVDLVALARQVIERFTQAGDRGRHAFALAAPRALTGRWDADRLDQIFTNLVGNALKYSPDGGEVAVRIRRVEGDRGGAAELVVGDEGIGIPAAERGALFQPFVRGVAASRIAEGTGLGLYITARLVERHGGTIGVESEPGRGSTFTVRLPLAPPGA